MAENRNQMRKPERPQAAKRAAGQRAGAAGKTARTAGNAPAQRRTAPTRNTAPKHQAPARPVSERQADTRTARTAPVNKAPARAPRRAAAPAARTQRAAAPQRRPAEESSFEFGSFLKGIIAVAVTCFAVCVIVIMFAKSLFVSDEELQKTAKTGRLTETAYEIIEPAKQQLRDEVVTTKATKKKKTTTTPQEEQPPSDLPEGLDAGAAGTYIVNSPVYLHPTADANSENLATLPTNAQVKVLGSSYGWYYVEYEGQKGYAWGTYFTPAG